MRIFSSESPYLCGFVRFVLILRGGRGAGGFRRGDEETDLDFLYHSYFDSPSCVASG